MTTGPLVPVRRHAEPQLLPARLGGPVRLTSPTWDVAIGRFLDWFALVRGRAPLTISTYARGLQGFVRFARAQDLLDPRAVTHREIEDYLGWLGSQGRRPALLLQHLAALRTFYRYLEREGVVPNNPAAAAFGPKKEHRMPSYLGLHEQERILSTLAQASTPHGQRDYAMVATALLTGLRCAELVGLRLDAVSFDGGFCRVVGKGSKTREVPLIPRLAAILTAYLRDARPALVLTAESPYVFPANLRPGMLRRNGTAYKAASSPRRSARYRLQLGAPLTTRGFFHVVRVRCSEIIGRDVHPHMLRHSFASRLRAKGADLQLIQEILGHESINTTTMYAHISTPLRTATVARLLEGDAPPVPPSPLRPVDRGPEAVVTPTPSGVSLRRRRDAEIGPHVAIGDRIRLVRGRLGLRQLDLAAKLGVGLMTLVRAERGARMTRLPRLPMLQRIAELGGVTVDWLLRGDPT